MYNERLAGFLSEVVLTSHYLARPLNKTEAEMTDAEMRCLKIISSFAPLSMHSIASKLYATKPRATQLVTLLESRKLVTRSVAQDRRIVEVVPTAKGRAAVRQLDQRYDGLAAAIEKRLGPEDTATLCRLLEAITPLTRLES